MMWSNWTDSHPNSILEESNELYSIIFGSDDINWVYYPFSIGMDLSGFDAEDYNEIEIENILLNSTTNNYNLLELDWRTMDDDDDLDWIEDITYLDYA